MFGVLLVKLAVVMHRVGWWNITAPASHATYAHDMHTCTINCGDQDLKMVEHY